MAEKKSEESKDRSGWASDEKTCEKSREVAEKEREDFYFLNVYLSIAFSP